MGNDFQEKSDVAHETPTQMEIKGKPKREKSKIGMRGGGNPNPGPDLTSHIPGNFRDSSRIFHHHVGRHRRTDVTGVLSTSEQDHRPDNLA